MFEALSARPPDAIMALMEMAKSDPNPNKVDLGVGVYKTEDGKTPIMRAVKLAEADYVEEEETKTYVATIGNARFRDEMEKLIFGENHPALQSELIASSQAVGGSGALRLGAELVLACNPDATIWVSTPTWANHEPLIGSVGLKLGKYPYYNRETLGVDFEDMKACLKDKAKPGDVVLLHGCCHNPTGADLSPAQWDEISSLINELDLIPFVDLAYFGLGRGFKEDTYGLLRTMAVCPEVIIAASCSKNFAMYKERVGLAAVKCTSPERAAIVQSQLGLTQRRLVSMPPDHGSAIVGKILSDPALRQVWESELTEMRERILTLRQNLSDELNVQGREDLARGIVNQNGLFTTLPVTKEQAQQLRSEFSVYMTDSGRINIAGANLTNIPVLAKAVLAVL